MTIDPRQCLVIIGGFRDLDPFAKVLRNERDTSPIGSQKPGRSVGCGLCLESCAFRKRYGSPKLRAGPCMSRHQGCHDFAFEDSLYDLFNALCPHGVTPSRLFMELRGSWALLGLGISRNHEARLRCDTRRTPRRYTLCALHGGCVSILFPGYTLAGSRPNQVPRLLQYLRNVTLCSKQCGTHSRRMASIRSSPPVPVVCGFQGLWRGSAGGFGVRDSGLHRIAGEPTGCRFSDSPGVPARLASRLPVRKGCESLPLDGDSQSKRCLHVVRMRFVTERVVPFMP